MTVEKTILLGISGGIAAYKSAELVRMLRLEGYRVQAIMTRAATKFITPLTLASLTGNKVVTDLFEGSSSEDTLNSAIEHIDVAKSGDLLLVAPATADVMAKFANGLADDFLSTTHLAFDGPVILAPAMNTNMWEHPATVKNLELLMSRGVNIVPPGIGDLACGTVGSGRLADLHEIVQCVHASFRNRKDLEGECVLVTAGPTREALDPVRYLSNRSSGRMGFAMAEGAAQRGAKVILVAGPVSLPTPAGCERIDVESAQQMHDAVLENLPEASIVVMTAAVADYRPAERAPRKLKKGKGVPTINLEKTPDILQEVGNRKGNRFLIGFAAETENLERNARSKLESKHCDLVVANLVGGTMGFDTEFNQGLILSSDRDTVKLDPMSKSRMAACIYDAAASVRLSKVA